MRKMKKLFFGAVILTILLTGCGGSKLPEGFAEEEVKAECLKAVDFFNQRDYQSILDMGSKEMQEALTAEQFAQQCDPQLDKKGEFQEIGKSVVMGNEDKSAGTSYAGMVLVGKYENGKIQFTIGFDGDMKLVQFVIK